MASDNLLRQRFPCVGSRVSCGMKAMLTPILKTCLLLALISPLCLAQTSTEANWNDIKRQRGQYYFRSGFKSYLKQAMTMGGYGEDETSDDDAFLDFSEEALLAELERIRMLKVENAYKREEHEKECLASDDHICGGDNAIQRPVKLNSSGTVIEEPPVKEAGNAEESANHTQDDVDEIEQLNSWEAFTYAELYLHFDCISHERDLEKSLYTKEDWEDIRERYWDFFGVPYQQIPDVDIDNIDGNEEVKNPTTDFVPPYYVAQTGDRGRGLYASRAIQKGELVHQARKYTVFFRTGLEWTGFITTLPRENACDVLEFTWTQKLEKTGSTYLCLNLDDSAFMNHGGEERSNVQSDAVTSLDFYAIEDIDERAEIVYDYNQYETPWWDFGLGDGYSEIAPMFKTMEEEEEEAWETMDDEDLEEDEDLAEEQDEVLATELDE